MDVKELQDRMYKAGVLPVIAIESPEQALPLADALIAGGLPVAEITFRTAAAAEVITILKAERPQLFLGAGTILSVENLVKAHELGALFGVAPGLNPAICRKAQEMGFPFFPGVVTPSEIEEGLSFGTRILKFFPAEVSGGTAMLKALGGPYPEVLFIPTGGVSADNLADYLALRNVLACGGSWLVEGSVRDKEDLEDIADRCRAAVALVLRSRQVCHLA